jgi:hypothetical protein
MQMKVQDLDLKPIQVLLDRINDTGCTYAHLDITSGRGEINFNMYTPETNHHRFTDIAKLTAHMEAIAGFGEGAVAVTLAKEKIARARQSIVDANEEIQQAEAILAKSTVDADGVPV